MTASLLALGCASSALPPLRERVGGAHRARAFASPTAYEAFLRGELAAARNDIPSALRQLDLAELADPSDGFIRARRVELLLAAGRTDEARSTAEELTRARPELSAAWLALAFARSRGGDAEGAMAAVARAVTLDPDDPDVRAAAAQIAGGDARSIAVARAGAPDARIGDRVLAARSLPLDPAGMFRRSATTRRRAAAIEHAARGEWAAVDAMLSPLVALDPSRVTDRVRVIEARAFDGRPADAAALIEGLRTGTDRAGVRAVERARLWLLAGRPELAAEEARAILQTAPNDVLARRVLGHSLVRSGRAAEGIEVLASVPLDAPALARVVVDPEAFGGTIPGGVGEVPGEAPDAPGVAWAFARIDSARALADSASPELADRLLTHAIAALRDASARGARDRLRVARASMLELHGAIAEARSALAEVETAWGRHRRGALLAFTEAPAVVLGDLRARSNELHEDALADAWIVLVCANHPGACPEADVRDALSRARTDAPSSPVTLRARAARTDDRREAAELVRRASARDPASPWTAAILRQLGGR